MWIIRCKKTHRAYVGEGYSRLYEDFMPEWELESEKYDRAIQYPNKENAEWVMKNWLHSHGDLEAFELPETT